MADPIKIDVWSDVACPWCYIGKRNLDAALEAFAANHPETPVEVEYRSFELQPEAPESFDGTIAEYLSTTRGMPEDQVAAMLERPRQAAEQAGIEMRFDRLRPARTTRAHELLHLAKAGGHQAELNELMMKANFEEGRSLGDPDELADLAVAAGIDRGEAVAALESGEYRDAVVADREKAFEYGIGGVPFFVVADRFGIAGAQPAEVLRQAMEQAGAEAQADGEEAP
ncbi:MAG: DsbA family oxidoreductase [Solirubrobacteraceae bacterium]|nr:DsbA family oxidoreductase [Solirubrobacteraceae bacterium]